MRPELDSLPSRMLDLPIDDRGYVVPWFVSWIDGKPEFRVSDAEKFIRAVRERRCWVCGERLGSTLCFVAGPMCGINRVSSEPPSHVECARWSARNCPFLVRPHMRRREDELINNETMIAEAPGLCIARNPGVTMLWITRSYKVFRPHAGGEGFLFDIGAPASVEWYAEGRPATGDEIQESVRGGFPALEKQAAEEGEKAIAALKIALDVFERDVLLIAAVE